MPDCHDHRPGRRADRKDVRRKRTAGAVAEDVREWAPNERREHQRDVGPADRGAGGPAALADRGDRGGGAGGGAVRRGVADRAQRGDDRARGRARPGGPAQRAATRRHKAAFRHLRVDGLPRQTARPGHDPDRRGRLHGAAAAGPGGRGPAGRRAHNRAAVGGDGAAAGDAGHDPQRVRGADGGADRRAVPARVVADQGAGAGGLRVSRGLVPAGRRRPAGRRTAGQPAQGPQRLVGRGPAGPADPHPGRAVAAVLLRGRGVLAGRRRALAAGPLTRTTGPVLMPLRRPGDDSARPRMGHSTLGGLRAIFDFREVSAHSPTYLPVPEPLRWAS
ncbi:hypothetical protein SCOCK_360027 [Actinacidiphila cocklensis]|uniref:Uncharacterized protein n=1 Tax=Actinacidiphila cocklensis TaxID=887465 RepID=A0A9W4E8Z4_9ACTN|nr:hypothetical protein SCOCK_360027 [Actinacidiphila cocklensis]